MHGITLFKKRTLYICIKLPKIENSFYKKFSVSSLEDGLELIYRAIRALLKPLVITRLDNLHSIDQFITEPIRQLFSVIPRTASMLWYAVKIELKG